jgi:hypothetical protein
MVDGFGSRVLVGPVVAATRYGVPLGAAIRWRLGYRHGYPIVRIGSGGWTRPAITATTAGRNVSPTHAHRQIRSSTAPRATCGHECAPADWPATSVSGDWELVIWSVARHDERCVSDVRPINGQVREDEGEVVGVRFDGRLIEGNVDVS